MAYQPTTWKNNETKLNADNMNNLERGITEVENNITSVETSINNLNTKTNTLTSKVTALEEADDTLNEKVTSLTNTSSDLTKKYNTLNTTTSTLTSDVSKLKAKTDELADKVSGVATDSNLSDLSKKVTDLEGTTSTLNTTVTSHTNTLKTLNTTVSGHTTSISNLEKSNTTLTTKVTNAEKNIGTLQTDLTSLTTRVTTLENSGSSGGSGSGNTGNDTGNTGSTSKNKKLADASSIVSFWGGSSYTVSGTTIQVNKLKAENTDGFGTPMLKAETGFLKIKMNITQLTGALDMYIMGTKKSNGESFCIWVKLLDSTGEQETTIDLANYSVYKDLNISEDYCVGITNNTGVGADCVATIEDFEVWDWSDTYSDVGGGSSSGSNGGSSSVSVNRYLTDIDGSKVELWVNNGVLKAIPVFPKNVVFVGNSLLAGWGGGSAGSFGKCASNPQSDYAYHIQEYIKAHNGSGTLAVKKITTWDYESCESTSAQDTWLTKTLKPALSDSVGMVFLQLGDNFNSDGANAVMERGLTEMCRFARRNAPNARVVLIGAWYGTTERQKKLLNASKNSGVMFVDIWDLHVEENQANVGDTITFTDGSTQKVQDTGDASHPSSKGMKLIADRIIEKCFNV